MQNKGTIIRITGPVLDARFSGHLPEINELLISESGVVVVCQGAENARVRLDIIRAVSSYTGFTSDKITILKMADYS